MIKRALSCAALALSAMTVSLAGANSAHAYQYGSFVIHNPSNVTINYQMKWGNDGYQNFSVEPGSWRSHYIELGSDQMIPVPYVRFDFVTWDQSVTYQTYEMDAYGTNFTNDGKDYTFQYTSDGRFLDLFED
jgi:hypothetical protein